ncbi:MAG: hypothetical protein WBG67_07510 [Thermoanaerobaculia bacterium]
MGFLWRMVVGALLALCLCSSPAAQLLSAGTGAPSAERVAIRRVGTVGQYVGLFGSSVSPDGRYLVFTDWTTGDLAVRDLVTDENRRVTNKGPFHKVVEWVEFFMRFSGDGKQLAYIWDKNGYELRAINVDGSGSRFIYRDEPEQGEMLRAFDWSADGKYVAAVVPRPGSPTTDSTLQIALVHVADGSVQGLKALSGPVPDEQRMSFSPDGRFLAYDFPVNGKLQKRDIFVLPLDGGEEISGVAHPGNDRLLDWTPDGSALLFTSDRAGAPDAWLQPLEDGKPQGVAQRVRGNLREDIRPLGFARNGDYYYATSETGQLEVYAASLDLEKSLVTESPAPVPQIASSNQGPDWSPDGKSLAYIRNGNSIVIRQLETGMERSLTPKALQNIFTVGWGERYLRWSPNGRHLLAPQNRTLFLVDVKSGEATPVVTDRRSRYGRWSRDGEEVFYARQLGLNDATVQIVRLNLETQQKEVLYTSELPGENLNSLEVSPDGRWLAFSDVALNKTTGDDETVLMVMPVDGGRPRLLLEVPVSETVKVVGWTPNTQEILFARDPKLAAKPSTTLWRIGNDGGEPRKLELGLNVLGSIRFHPDGRRVAFDSGQRGAEIWVMEDVLSLLKASE